MNNIVFMSPTTQDETIKFSLEQNCERKNVMRARIEGVPKVFQISQSEDNDLKELFELLGKQQFKIISRTDDNLRIKQGPSFFNFKRVNKSESQQLFDSKMSWVMGKIQQLEKKVNQMKQKQLKQREHSKESLKIELKNYLDQMVKSLDNEKKEKQKIEKEKQNKQKKTVLRGFSDKNCSGSVRIEKCNTKAAISQDQEYDSGWSIALVDGTVQPNDCMQFKFEGLRQVPNWITQNIGLGLVYQDIVKANQFEVEDEKAEELDHGCIALFGSGEMFFHQSKKYNNVQTWFEFLEGQTIRIEVQEHHLIYFNENEGTQYRMKIRISPSDWSRLRFAVFMDKEAKATIWR